MKHGWEYRDFEKCLEKVIYTSKLQSSNYKESGKYPIVSQEECLISGYWDNEEDVFHLVKPIVVFGDHTRVLKYIDFDFVLGADGVKILQPTNDLKAKFLYYYLKWYNVPSLGYSRHYKLLKECSVPIPPLPVQEQICSLLDKMNRVIEAKKEQLKELGNLAQAIFYDMFGDPTVNDKGWEKQKLGDCFSYIKNGANIKQDKSQIGFPITRIETLSNGVFNRDRMGYAGITDKTKYEQYILQDKDLLMSHINSKAYIGRTVLYRKKEGEVFIHGMNLLRLVPLPLLDSEFFCYLAKTDYVKEKIASIRKDAVNQSSFAISDIKKIDIPIPPLPLQQSFAEKVEAIERQKELINQSIKDVQTLFDAKMDYYFGD